MNSTSSGDFTANDLRIAQEINSALRVDSAVQQVRVTVEVRNGVVALRGNVSSAIERRLAGLLAMHSTGLTMLSNTIQVRPSAPPSRTSTDEIYIRVRRGDVTLECTVPSTQRLAAGAFSSAVHHQSSSLRIAGSSMIEDK